MTATIHCSNLAEEPNYPLALAIERHRLAAAACDADRGPQDIDQALVDVEDEAFAALAETSCADNEAFREKLRYMLADQKRRYGPIWDSSEAPEILTALDLHVNRAEPAPQTPAVPWWRDRLAWLALLMCRFLARRALALVHAEV